VVEVGEVLMAAGIARIELDAGNRGEQIDPERRGSESNH